MWVHAENRCRQTDQMVNGINKRERFILVWKKRVERDVREWMQGKYGVPQIK